jgi:hypothetical protein
MKIFGYELRTPWIKYVDMPIEEELYNAVHNSIKDNIAAEVMYILNQSGDVYYNIHELREYFRKKR